LNCVNVVVFPTIFELTEQNKFSFTDGILEIIKFHLEHLRLKCFKYFPEVEKENSAEDWVINPFHTTAISSSDLPLKLRDTCRKCPLRDI
jgi:hypothetical protein